MAFLRVYYAHGGDMFSDELYFSFAPQATLQLLTIEFLYGFFGFKSI